MIQAITKKISKHAYLLFFTKSVIFITIVFILDFSIGGALNYLYFSQKSGNLYRTTYSINKTKADILIVGSSRANHHYVSDIFEQRFHLTCYNTGSDGSYIFYHHAVLKAVLQRYVPKIVVLDLSENEFDNTRKSYDRISTLLPYYNSHLEMRSIIENRSIFEKYKLLSKIYPFNSMLFSLTLGDFKLIKIRKDDFKGYIPLYRIWKKRIKTKTEKKYELDYNKLEQYENFIKDCVGSGIQLFVFVSPYYKISNYTDRSVAVGQEIAQKYHVKFFDCSKDTLYTKNRFLFADIVHLNDKGARLYTIKVVDKMVNDK